MTCSLSLYYAEGSLSFFFPFGRHENFGRRGGLGFSGQIRFIPFIAFFGLFCCKFIQPQDWYIVYIP